MRYLNCCNISDMYWK